MFGEALRPFFCTFVRRISLMTIMRAKIKNQNTMEDYVITEYDELLTKDQAEKHNYKIVRKATREEIREHEKESAFWVRQSQDEQHKGSYHDIG